VPKIEASEASSPDNTGKEQADGSAEHAQYNDKVLAVDNRAGGFLSQILMPIAGSPHHTPRADKSNMD
jgi:hypothetical protein